MAQQLFVNAMGTDLTRSGAVLDRIVVTEGILPHTPIRLIADGATKTIKVVPDDGGDLPGNPFDERILDNDFEEPIIWVAAPSVGFVATLANKVKILRIDGGFLVALVKGKMQVARPNGDTLELSRDTASENDQFYMNSPEKFRPFHSRVKYEGHFFDDMSWDVLFDMGIKQALHLVKDGIEWADQFFTGFEKGAPARHLLDFGHYKQVIADEKAAAVAAVKAEEAKREAAEDAASRKNAEAFLEAFLR